MAEPRLIQEGDLPFAEVQLGDRLRPVSDAGVQSVITSIETVGMMKDAIYVRRVRHRDNALVLIAGAHRLTAAQRMGWETMPMRIFECNDAWAQLMEIDDNLASSDLSPLELATFLARRKAVYEKAHPAAKNGGDRKSGTYRENQNDILSFCSSAAEKRGVSRRTIERLTRVGERLSPATVHSLHHSTKPVTFKMLDDLSLVSDQAQTPVAQMIASGRHAKVKEALAEFNGSPKPAKPNAEDAAYQRLIEGFSRAPMVAKRRFLNQLWIDHPDLMASEAEKAAEEIAA